MSTDIFGLPKGDPDAVADQLGVTLGLEVERHSSAYLGDYCFCRGTDGTRLKILRNREPRGKGLRPAVDPPIHK